jgi:sugar transferase (PEP-CTERM system associated)
MTLLFVEGWILLASALVSLHFDPLGGESVRPGFWPSLFKAVVLSLLVLMVLHLTQLYDLRRIYGRRELFLRLFLAFATAYILMAAAGYLGPALHLGRRAYALSFLLSFTAVFASRLILGHLLQNARNRRRLLLLGSGRPAQIIADAVNGTDPNYEMVGCVDGQPERIGQLLNGVRILGTVEDLSRVSQSSRPDVIVVALTERRQCLPLPAILECKLQGIKVEDWPNFYEELTGKILLTDLRPSWLIFSDGFSRSNVTMSVKRGMDFLLAALGLLVTLPLFPLIALLIKLDSPGPVFYRQERLGEGGTVFWLVKFRSMRNDAEAQTGPVWAGERDPRVTRVGRILRRTRLDELPQLMNVLRGEMSLVGPRPERPAFIRELQEKIPFYLHRLAVKPGLTGWAQVKYHYGSTVEDALEKLQYDFYYVKNLSIFLDLLILLHTLQVVLLGKGSR